MNYFRSAAIFCAGLLIGGSLSAQEVLLSDTENYYDFLALQGLAERPYLNYRTLSDSKWEIVEGADHPWKDSLKDPVRELSDSVRFRIYGPELFTSYNSAAPYGQNDGVLWQGRGFNSSISAGARLEAYGLELTFKPTVAYSQNLAFDLVKPAYSGDAYSEKAEEYGYYGVKSIDAPQRFGDDPFFDYSWGDSEIRYTWKSLTAGFGTQLIWLGPAKINPIIHSNNAPPYPKFDIGLRKTSIVLPKLDWYLGDIETRLWWGYLSESDWFDNDNGNDHNMISGLTVAYAPPVFEGLTLFANRTYLAKLGKENFSTIPSLFFIDTRFQGDTDVWDQRASLGFDYHVASGWIEVYGEAGINDYGISADGYVRYPFHSMVYMSGFKKAVSLPFRYIQQGELIVEWSNLEISQDFQFQWPSTFYAHHQITQGYTNQGQWLGSGNGTGGNSQYVGFSGYHHDGYVRFFIKRRNHDNDYVYSKSVKTTAGEEILVTFKAEISAGVIASYYCSKRLSINVGLTYISEHNPLYNPVYWAVNTKVHSVRIDSTVSYYY